MSLPARASRKLKASSFELRATSRNERRRSADGGRRWTHRVPETNPHSLTLDCAPPRLAVTGTPRQSHGRLSCKTGVGGHTRREHYKCLNRGRRAQTERVTTKDCFHPPHVTVGHSETIEPAPLGRIVKGSRHPRERRRRDVARTLIRAEIRQVQIVEAKPPDRAQLLERFCETSIPFGVHLEERFAAVMLDDAIERRKRRRITNPNRTMGRRTQASTEHAARRPLHPFEQGLRSHLSDLRCNHQSTDDANELRQHRWSSSKEDFFEMRQHDQVRTNRHREIETDRISALPPALTRQRVHRPIRRLIRRPIHRLGTCAFLCHTG